MLKVLLDFLSKDKNTHFYKYPTVICGVKFIKWIDYSCLS